jgi:hypothetical protein
MQTDYQFTQSKHRRRLAAGGAVAILFAAGVLQPAIQASRASSHREAPVISNDAQADTTDVYAFVSPDRPDSVTLIGSWIPLEAPEGGPNYYRFSDDITYTINIDNVGDAQAHIKYEFNFKTSVRNPATFLYNTGPVTSLNDADWNVRQFYTVTEVVSDTVGVTRTVLFGNKLSTPVNIGEKSTPNWQALSDEAIYSTGTGANEIKVFTGQTDDPFWVDLGSVFDLLTLRMQQPPIGYSSGLKPGLDGLRGYNVHSIAIQVPTSRLLVNQGANTDPTIGVWATSHRPSIRTFGGLGVETSSGPAVQVSRLGMPLVNEVVVPLALKDAFNSIPPSVDAPLATGQIPGLEPAGALLLSSVLTPELQTLLNGLYQVPNPGKPRSDIFDIFLQGIVTAQPFTITTKNGPFVLPAGYNVNRPKAANRQPAEMLRLNTSIKGDLCAPTPNYQLGMLGGDACGFPNGRRLADDVTEIELLAVAGAAWRPLTNDNSFAFNPALVNVLTDSVERNDVPFRATFPYLGYAHSGQTRLHSQPYGLVLPWMYKNSGPAAQ